MNGGPLVRGEQLAIRIATYGDPDVSRIIEEIQAEYVVRYGRDSSSTRCYAKDLSA